MNYLFPLAFMANTLSMTFFLICLGLAGNTIMAADIGIVQGATLALFYALSANARNLILNEKFPLSAKSIMAVRIVLAIPVLYAAYYLSSIISGVEASLAIILILRRLVEWLGEVHLSEMERIGNYKFSRNYLVVQILLLMIILGWFIGRLPLPLLGLSLWAILPLFLSVKFIYKSLKLIQLKQKKAFKWCVLLPHVGSTTIIGVTVYIFRLLLISLLGKADAGDLFTAFAMGGVLGSLFSSGLGPSLVFYQKNNDTRNLPILINLALLITLILGLSLYCIATFKLDTLSWTGKNLFFWKATGISAIGGVVMAFAQLIRYRLLQHHDDRDLYGPDTLMNILMIIIVPFVYSLFGIQGMAGLFLLNALIAFFFYLSSEMQDRIKIPNLAWTVILVMLLLPVFFQVSNEFFPDTAIIFNQGGVLLSKFPIPLSEIGLLGGILIASSYKRATLSVNFIFLTFILMITVSVLGKYEQLVQQRDKFILLIQFVLPMFGLILGQMYDPKPGTFNMEKSFLYVLVTIVPLQLLFTLYGYGYLLTIYQHL